MAYTPTQESESDHSMVIVETSVFTRQVQALLSDEEYRQLQVMLIQHPDLGPVIPGSGGLRKMRGKRRAAVNVVERASSTIEQQHRTDC